MTEQKPVLWCAQCNKPFTKESALKRHGYYCRSNKRGVVSRRRSCAACAQAKTGCDNARPTCLRCTQRCIACFYPFKSMSRGRNAVETRRVVPDDLHDLRHEQANLTISAVTDQTHGLGQTTRDTDCPIFSTGMQWNLDDTTVLGDFMHPTPQLSPTMSVSSLPARNEPTSILPSLLLPNSMSSEFQAQTQLECPSMRQGPSPQLLDFSISPALTANVRSMMQRPKMQYGTNGVASLISCTLKSYPIMLRQNALPPFIHPNHMSFTDENSASESLDNCISLMQMMASKVSGSRKLFWRNVQQECERICEQQQFFNRWELLGAMQALSIYVLIRLEEGETEHNNIDFPLERAVILTAIQLSRNDVDCRMQHVSCSSEIEGKWENWIYKESRRRLAVVYRVIDILVFFDPAAMCDMPAEFVIAPLPAKRQLWEARNAKEWKLQCQNGPPEQISYALAVNGEIVKLSSQRLSCRDAWLAQNPFEEEAAAQDFQDGTTNSATWWAEWCSGMDSMGGLIMLAASAS